MVITFEQALENAELAIQNDEAQQGRTIETAEAWMELAKLVRQVPLLTPEELNRALFGGDATA